jgi:membrane dipeptidase
MFLRLYPLVLMFLVGTACLGQQYEKLHKQSILVDTHNDVLSTVTMKGLNMENDLRGKSHSDLGRFKNGGVDVQIFSIFCDERFGKDTAFKYANVEIDSLFAIANRNPSKVTIVTDLAGIKHAIKEKKLAAMMGVEGGHMIEDNLNYLDSFFRRGVRYLTLTWNNSTSWATSAKDESQHTLPNPKAGLNDFGKQLVRRMNELGMIVDVSHNGEQTFWDVINTTSKPVIASHSCAYTLCPVFRNLKDEQIKAIGKNGGVIHLNFYSGFVDSGFQKRKDAFLVAHQSQKDSLQQLKWASYEVEEWMAKTYPAEAEAIRPPLSMLIDHLDYIVKLIGIDHVGLGSDFDGIDSAPMELNGVDDFPKITKALLERGYTKKQIRKILGGNFLRVLRNNESKR